MRVALDTNILAYVEGVNDEARRTAAKAILAGLEEDDVFVPAQALGELIVVLLRKGRRTAADARVIVRDWARTHTVIGTTSDILGDALDLATTHRFAFWDAVILSAAASIECDTLLSEDMSDGFTWRGVTTPNPFTAPAPH